MKQAQITVFIILGIVILAVVAFLLYVSGVFTESSLKQLTEKTQAIPLQAQPVNNYITSCVEETAKEGILLLGSQGGYINIPRDNLPRSVINPFSNSLALFNGYEVPYWFYESSNGIQKIQVPSTQEMEQQLSNYLNEELNNCLFNLSFFKEYGIEFQGDIKSEVNIYAERVDVKVVYPVLVNIEGITTSLEQYDVHIRVPLGRMTEMAGEILKKENEEYFLEKFTEDALVLYEEIPYHGESLDCQPRTWLKQDIEKQLREILSFNINSLTIADTENSEQEEYFKVRLPRPNYRDLEAKFIYYPEWPIALEINGGDEILKEESATGSIGLVMNLLCIQSHNFIYDMKYPVLIQLYDDKSLDGFTFQFATQVILDNNQPRENRLGIDEFTATEKRVCASADMPISVYAIDDKTGDLLNNARISFICTGTSCELGETNINSEGDYALTTKVPQCLNGIIEVEKDGYSKGSIITNTLSSADVFISLKPVFVKDLIIKVIENGNVRNLRDDESAVISFSDELGDYETLVTDESEEIGLVESSYSIKGYITRDRSITLEDKDVEYCIDVPRRGILGLLGSTKKECKKTTIEGTTLDSILIGGAEFSYSFDNLEEGENVIIYLVVDDIPVDVRELQSLYEKIPLYELGENFRYPELA